MFDQNELNPTNFVRSGAPLCWKLVVCALHICILYTYHHLMMEMEALVAAVALH
jgi:hypothetical protein